MKKSMLKILSLALVAALLGGCVSALATEDAKEPVVIRIAWWGNQVRNERTAAVLDLYTQLNPHVTFQTEFTDWAGYWPKLQAEAPNGNMADIIQMDYQYIAEYQKNNQLADLSALVDGGFLSLENIAEGVLSSGMFDGKLYGLACGFNAPSVIVNQEMLDAAGVEVAFAPTYQDFLKIAPVVFEKTGAYGIHGIGTDQLLFIARGYGERLYNDENRLGISRETLLKVFDVIEAARDSDFQIPPDLETEKAAAGIEGSAIATHVAWNTNAWTNQIVTHQNANDQKLSMVLQWGMDDFTAEANYLKPSMLWSITEASTQKEVAADVLNFMTHSEEAFDIFLAERGIPSSSVIADHIKPTLSAVEQEVFDFVAKITDIAAPIDPPQPAGAAEVGAAYSRILEEFTHKLIEKEAAVDQFIAEANEILERANP